MILAVGYRVRSHVGTQFRRWATERLREYIVKGFTMDDERLKEGRNLGADYFDELLERIRFAARLREHTPYSCPASQLTQRYQSSSHASTAAARSCSL